MKRSVLWLIQLSSHMIYWGKVTWLLMHIEDVQCVSSIVYLHVFLSDNIYIYYIYIQLIEGLCFLCTFLAFMHIFAFPFSIFFKLYSKICIKIDANIATDSVTILWSCFETISIIETSIKTKVTLKHIHTTETCVCEGWEWFHNISPKKCQSFFLIKILQLFVVCCFVTAVQMDGLRVICELLEAVTDRQTAVLTNLTQ